MGSSEDAARGVMTSTPSSSPSPYACFRGSTPAAAATAKGPNPHAGAHHLPDSNNNNNDGGGGGCGGLGDMLGGLPGLAGLEDLAAPSPEYLLGADPFGAVAAGLEHISPTLGLGLGFVPGDVLPPFSPTEGPPPQHVGTTSLKGGRSPRRSGRHASAFEPYHHHHHHHHHHHNHQQQQHGDGGLPTYPSAMAEYLLDPAGQALETVLTDDPDPNNNSGEKTSADNTNPDISQRPDTPTSTDQPPPPPPPPKPPEPAPTLSSSTPTKYSLRPRATPRVSEAVASGAAAGGGSSGRRPRGRRAAEAPASAPGDGDDGGGGRENLAPAAQGSARAKPRPPPLSKYRRKTANARERDRMREINAAFELLRKAVPVQSPGLSSPSSPLSLHGASSPCGTGVRSPSDGSSSSGEKLTKITTLRLAMRYITALTQLLQSTSPPSDNLHQHQQLQQQQPQQLPVSTCSYPMHSIESTVSIPTMQSTDQLFHLPQDPISSPFVSPTLPAGLPSVSSGLGVLDSLGASPFSPSDSGHPFTPPELEDLFS